MSIIKYFSGRMTEETAGVYECRASNGVVEVSTEHRVTSICAPLSPPTITPARVREVRVYEGGM